MTTTMETTAQRGARLEQAVAAYLAAQGYAVETNVVVEGRSGGRHEVDVLARKDDGVVDHTLLVECKAWDAPIAKETLSKTHYVLRDCGFDRAIVVAAGGATSGALAAARELGIDVWGPAELALRPGLADLPGLGRASLTAPAVPFATTAGDARRAFRRTAGRRARAFTLTDVWIPVFAFQLRVSDWERRGWWSRRMRYTARERVVWREALGGGVLAVLRPPAEAEAPAERCLRPLLRPATLRAEMMRTHQRAINGNAGDARLRLACERLGIPTPAEGRPRGAEAQAIEVTGVRLTNWPVYAAIETLAGGLAVHAIDGVTGRPSAQLSALLTVHSGSLAVLDLDS